MRRLSILIFSVFNILAFTGCDDMLESESTRQAFNPGLGASVDSVFYMAGILNGMQQLADMYVLQNEMRGDMATTTVHSDTNLVRLADYEATTSNKYDSAYVYFRVINNCNYYLQHRDTTLQKGNDTITLGEYAAVEAMRAWAYLQAVRQYGKVRYFEEPKVKISDIDNDQSPEYNIYQVADALTRRLERFSGKMVPNYGGSWSFGSTNTGTTPTINNLKLMVPVDVILGDLYLEMGQYMKAARHYYVYLSTAKKTTGEYLSSFSADAFMALEDRGVNIPDGFAMMGFGGNLNWATGVFTSTSQPDIVSYVPMAVNFQKGVTSELPGMFGYDYYAIDRDNQLDPDMIQIAPSAVYYQLADSCDYYYIDRSDATGLTRSSFKAGDMRRWSLFKENSREREDTCQYFIKYQQGFVYLYRVTTVYLHMAEALNRAGYPDAAFAILKDGLNSQLLTYVMSTDEDGITTGYVRPETYKMLTEQMPMFYNSETFQSNAGIHMHGCSDMMGSNYGTGGTHSAYQLDAVAGEKMAELNALFGVSPDETAADSLAAVIDAVEDLLCDEYALEFTLEGTRFSDLSRMARHKNDKSPAGYGSNYGGRWFDHKIKRNRPSVTKDLTIESNWYLPFK